MTSERAVDSDLANFGNIELSYLQDHQLTCCEATHRRFDGRLAQADSPSAALALLPEIVHWRPMAWPAHWCDVMAEDDLQGDCGVLGFLASTILMRFKVPHERVAVALISDAVCRAHWRARWERANMSVSWMGEATVYHEAVRVADRYWDPLEARWFAGLGAVLEGGAVAAIRAEGKNWQVC